MHHLASPRYPIKKLGALIPPRFYERNLEQNQLAASCCRQAQEHEIEAWYSSETDRDRGVPDIYKLFCKCGRTHTIFCVGGSAGSGPDAPLELRPKWEIA